MRVVVTTMRRTRRVTATASLTRIPSRMPVTLQTVAAQLVVERLQTDSENLRGLRLVVAVGGQRLEDQALLGVVEAGADGEGDGVRAVGGAPGGPRRRDRRRQMREPDQLSVADDGGPLDGVPQLPDIAGPGLGHQGLPHPLVHGQNALVVLRAELLDEGLDEEREVL